MRSTSHKNRILRHDFSTDSVVVNVNITEVSTFHRGLTYKKTDEAPEQSGLGVLRANNVTLEGLLCLDNVKYVNPNVKIKDSQKLKKNDILMCVASGSKKHIGKSTLIKRDSEFVFGGFMSVLRVSDMILPNYLYHLLKSKKFRTFIDRSIYGANINNLKETDLGKFNFNLPEVNVQRQIVRILDRYETVANSLNLALATENVELQKQYDYYLRKILSKEYLSSTVEPEIGSLGEFVTMKRGSPLTKVKAKQGDIPVIAGGKGVAFFHDEFNRGSGSITVSSSGRAGYVAYHERKIFASDCFTVETKVARVSQRFLYYFLKSRQEVIYSMQSKGAIPHVYIRDLEHLELLVPSLKLQNEIVSKLDRLNGYRRLLTDELTSERELNNVQFEYYRDGLLTF